MNEHTGGNGMKVIAIVNLPFDVDPSKEDAYFAMRDGKYCQKVCLRPLPCKKYMRQMPSNVLEMGKRKRDFIIHRVDVDNSYVEGWNDCLEAITGETE